MMIRRAAVLTACGLIGACLSACAVAPEPPAELQPDVPLPPRRPPFGLGHRDEGVRRGRGILFRPKVLRVKPRPALRPTLQAAEPRPPEPAAVPPSPAEVPPTSTGSVTSTWGSPIPGSVPVLPRGWEPPP